jgi:hypothetical protein
MNTPLCWPEIKKRVRNVTVLAGVAVSGIAMLLHPVGTAVAQQVFFGPVPNTATPNGFTTDLDFPDLFNTPSEWAGGMARISAMLYRTRYVQTTPDAVLQAQFAFLNQHQIAVAAVMGMTIASNCGQGLEGMVYGANVNASVAKRLAALGANVRYLVADEPLTFGHYSMLKGACQYSIPTLASQFGEQVAQIRQIFPSIQIIDDEAATRLQIFPDVAQWIAALRASLGGQNAAFTMGLDVQWQQPWTTWAQEFVAFLQQQKLRYGLLAHGTGQDATDAAWLGDAESTYQAWEQLIPQRPSFVSMQSWNVNPTHSLPETDPTAFTSLILTLCANTHWRLACNGLH